MISSDEVNFLLLSLEDLITTEPAVEAFVSKESRLGFLFNTNVSLPPRSFVSA